MPLDDEPPDDDALPDEDAPDDEPPEDVVPDDEPLAGPSSFEEHAPRTRKARTQSFAPRIRSSLRGAWGCATDPK